MSYLHIDNLIKNQNILLFKECYAMEKIHGTSAHVLWKDGKVILSSGGESSEKFSKLFDISILEVGFLKLGHTSVCVYGEAYGGKQQGMSGTYGKDLRFIAFEVRIGGMWLNVPNAEEVSRSIGFDFVHYVKVKTTLEELDTQRSSPSEQAFRNYISDRDKPETYKMREGIVLRPLIEVTTNNGERIIAKYKNEQFSERKSGIDTGADPAKMRALADANAIAEEFVTEMRLTHVLDSIGNPTDESKIPELIRAMISDIEREGRGEIVESKDSRRAISKKAVDMFKKRISEKLRSVMDTKE